MTISKIKEAESDQNCSFFMAHLPELTAAPNKKKYIVLLLKRRMFWRVK